jgi:hypothetical protein
VSIAGFEAAGFAATQTMPDSIKLASTAYILLFVNIAQSLSN